MHKVFTWTVRFHCTIKSNWQLTSTLPITQTFLLLYTRLNSFTDRAHKSFQINLVHSVPISVLYLYSPIRICRPQSCFPPSQFIMSSSFNPSLLRPGQTYDLKCTLAYTDPNNRFHLRSQTVNLVKQLKTYSPWIV